MESLKSRLATSTALVTAVLTFYNLPVQANAELLEDGHAGIQGIHRVAVKETVSLKDAPIQDLPLDTQKPQIQATLREVPTTVEVAPKPTQQMIDPTGKEMTPATLKPLIHLVDGKPQTTLTAEEFDNLKDMNDVAYNLVKGYGTHNELAQPILERLQKEGWKYTTFMGLEGVTNNFGTTAGMIFFHPEKNQAVLCDIGTATNVEGWETNSKAGKTALTVHEMQHQYVKDLYIEAKDMIDAALHPEERATDPLTALNQAVLNIIENKLGIGINILDSKSVNKAAAKLNKTAIHKHEMNEATLLQEAQKLVREYLGKSKLNDKQLTTIAKELVKEALTQRDLVKISKNEDYRKALKLLKEEFTHYQNMNRKPLMDKFERMLDSLTTSSKKSKHHEALSDEVVKFGKEDHSFQKAILGYGALKLQLKEGKLAANPVLADHLDRLFDVKLKVMSTVVRLEDRALKSGKDEIALGDVHLGYLQKTISTLPEATEKLKAFGVNSETKLLVTGHSQGGGLAAQTAILLTAHFGQELFGQGHEVFDNKKTHNVSVYVFSAARAGDETFVEWAQEILGKDEFCRHNVTEDIVPIICADTALGAWVKSQNPILYTAMRDSFGYADIGHLAVQSGHETWQIAKQMYAEQGYDVSKFDKLDRFIRFMASFKFGADGVPTALAGEAETISFIYQPGRYVWDAIWGSYAVTYTGVQGIRALMGNEQIMSEMAELFMKRYAHLHLGFDDGVSKDGTHLGAHFKPALIIHPNKALENGVEHEMKRAQRKAIPAA